LKEAAKKTIPGPGKQRVYTVIGLKTEKEEAKLLLFNFMTLSVRLQTKHKNIQGAESKINCSQLIHFSQGES
jgi:hypothetical protein